MKTFRIFFLVGVFFFILSPLTQAQISGDFFSTGDTFTTTASGAHGMGQSYFTSQAGYFTCDDIPDWTVNSLSATFQEVGANINRWTRAFIVTGDGVGGHQFVATSTDSKYIDPNTTTPSLDYETYTYNFDSVDLQEVCGGAITTGSLTPDDSPLFIFYVFTVTGDGGVISETGNTLRLYLDEENLTYENGQWYSYGSGQVQPDNNISDPGRDWASFTLSGDGATLSCSSSGLTCITSTTPVFNSLIATSTTFTLGATGVLSSSDLNDTYVTLKVYNNAGVASNNLVGPLFASCATGLNCDNEASLQENIVYKIFSFPLTASGAFSLSTTTSLTQIGRYTYDLEIIKSSFFFFSNKVLTLKGSFTVGTSTQFDFVQEYLQEELDEAFIGIDWDSSACAFDWSTTFSIIDCVKFLLIPDSVQINEIIDNAKEGIFFKAPWGYATRILDIMLEDSATTTLPSLAFTVPSGVAGVGRTFDFTPWPAITQAVSDIDNKAIPTITGSPLDMFLTYWNMLWYIVFAFWLIKEFYSVFNAGDFEHVPTSSERKRTKFKRDVQNVRYRKIVRKKANSLDNRQHH